jgi:predicted RNA binding protein YcfA (HicA-like mRNA interferase family)
MSKREKAIKKLRRNRKNVRFEEIDSILLGLGCEKRQKGSHAIYTYPGLPPITVPYRKPHILPVYVKEIIFLIDQIEELE